VGGVSEVLPVDLHIAGCPPPPTEILKGLLALLEGVSAKAGAAGGGVSMLRRSGLARSLRAFNVWRPES
jgi:NADH:ubiquinone oxidoreductase subunit B-like Fe-S oxidoreductase